MSKRHIFPQQHGERKKAKLNVSISDHNFPLSQNANTNKEFENNWGDDNDDEILLLASQACEDAYENDASLLPDYSMCMQPGSTSTQLFEPQPSTSKAFTFKKPSAILPHLTSTNLKDKCSMISSPLPGISKLPNAQAMTDDLIFNDKIYKAQDPDYAFKQLLLLQEENTKLISENGKLLEKCVTKEGEASILRTQLKSCQVSVDNARLERVKGQERVQMEWTEKLTKANKQMQDLMTQLDFKNLELINLKEKCRMLESNKIKLTQVTVTGNDISSSNRNNSMRMPRDISNSMRQAKQVKTTSNAVQTDTRSHMLKLNVPKHPEITNLTNILPIILEPTSEQNYKLLECNEKLQNNSQFTQNNCIVFNRFHRIPSTPAPKEVCKREVCVNSLYEDVTSVAAGDACLEKYFRIVTTAKSILMDVQSELTTVSKRMTTAFQREMNEKYIEATAEYLSVGENDLLCGRLLYKEEQCVLARRSIAMLYHMLEHSRSKLLDELEKNCDNGRVHVKFVDIVCSICSLLDNNSCAILYSGLILSITYLVKYLLNRENNSKIIEMIKLIIISRPMPFVSCEVLRVLKDIAAKECSGICTGSNVGNLRTDFDQGVLLYKKDSCFLQVLLKQVEASLKCMEKQMLTCEIRKTTQSLLAFYCNFIGDSNFLHEKSRCDCRLVLIQVTVYALRICAIITQTCRNEQNSKDLLPLCRSGVQILYKCIIRDVEFVSRLTHNEGHLIVFCEVMKTFQHSEVYNNMLTEMAGTFQTAAEETPPSYHRQAWLESFESFSLVD